MRLKLALAPRTPTFSLVLIVTDPHEIWLRRTFDSVLRQVHQGVELCVCDNGSTASHVRGALEDGASQDDRIKLIRLDEVAPVGAAVAETLKLASGDFVAFVSAGDVLAADALFQIAELHARVSPDVVFTDEDFVDEVDEWVGRLQKPYWSPELHLARPYIGRLCAIRRTLLEQLGSLATHDAWEHDLMLRVVEKASRVKHLPLPLYRRRALPADDTEDQVNFDAVAEATRKALERRGDEGVVTPGLAQGSVRTIRRPSRKPKISAIVSLPRAASASPMARDLERRTAVELEEVILIGGRPGAVPGAERIEGTAPADAVNRAAERAKGDLLMFVDGRCRLGKGVGAGWLAGMAARAQEPGVGAVTCQLKNADGTLRYGGIAVNLNGLSLGGCLDSRPIPREVPVALHPSNPAVVRAECMLIDARQFAEADGFNDQDLPASFYDFDLSFRLTGLGLHHVYTPYVSMICPPPTHYPTSREISYMWQTWWEQLVWLLSYDPSPANLVRPDRVAHVMREPGVAVQP